MKDKLNGLVKDVSRNYKRRSVQVTVSVSFTIISVICMLAMGFTLYDRYVENSKQLIIEKNKQIIDQASLNLNDYIRNMMRISDTMYYSVIKNKDLAYETMDSEMTILYEANKDNLISIACFDDLGTLVAATPIAATKSDIFVKEQKWFNNAYEEIENLHFSTPHVQDLFDDNNYRYYWVVSLSRMVELTERGRTTKGILLVDMNFNAIEQLFSKINAKGEGYVYLIGGEGDIIYHPKQKAIYSNLVTENNLIAADYEDGSHMEEFMGGKRAVVVKTVGYTGWKIVSVTPILQLTKSLDQFRLLTVIICITSVVIVTLGNIFISQMVTNPIRKLDKSVKDLENGNLELDIYIGGPHEIMHLGKTIKSVVGQMKKLMENIVKEQEAKRKSELDALQSQINPHFLYNTLDSIVWMIEGEQYKEAISMIKALASLFRVSLSRGNNIITIKDEISHARNYIKIQKVRYKNKFTVEFNISPEIEQCSTIKLIVQPLLENAIYYGMEFMDGEGEIKINGYEKSGDIYIEIIDNGLGIPKEEVDLLLTDNTRARKRGSGIGLINVHQRIKLYFGEKYGLKINSEPDEGTCITIHLPQKDYLSDTEN